MAARATTNIFQKVIRSNGVVVPRRHFHPPAGASEATKELYQIALGATQQLERSSEKFSTSSSNSRHVVHNSSMATRRSLQQAKALDLELTSRGTRHIQRQSDSATQPTELPLVFVDGTYSSDFEIDSNSLAQQAA
mmetsp:Transcript_8205/g.12986  ORF Transcript_8205/g.12986 Transcript_8205/m.12986 type:complete len:136 (-) Transcript_8205:132-539(-)